MKVNPFSRRLAGATATLFILFTLHIPMARGHGDHDHDHDDDPPAASGNGPHRLPDGRVFLPRSAQHQFDLHTTPVVQADLPISHELAGKIVMDPNAGGKVQAMVAGRLEAGPKGFPLPGQRVRKGEILAWVQPANSQIERSNQTALLADLQAAAALVEKRLARWRQLADTVPQKDIDAAETERDSLRQRIAALGEGLNGRDALRAPIAGVVATSNAVAGQVVDARELVFEIIDPLRLHVEALTYTPELALDVAGGSLAIGQVRIPLIFLGAARSLREQALPLRFRANGAALASLAIGQPVKVFVQTRRTVRGFAIPRAALMRNPANQTIVWVMTGPEHFAPRIVSFQPIDGAQVAILGGLEAGDLVVTTAATLVNQIR